MRRHGRADRLLLVTLVPLWVVCVLLQVDRQRRPAPLAWVPVYVEPAASGGAHPVVWATWDGAPASDLRAGDTLLALGGRDLAGAGRVDVIVAAYAAAGEGGVAPVRFARDGEAREGRLPLLPVPVPWTHLLISLSVGLSGVLVLLRGRARRASRAYAAVALVFSLHFCSIYGGPPWATRFAVGLLIASATLYPPLLVRAVLCFPASAAPRGRVARAAPWALVVTGPAFAAFLLGVPSLGWRGFGAAGTCFAATIVVALAAAVRNYRVADARGRRQLRWGLYGLFVGMVPPALVALVSIVDPSWRVAYERSLASQALIPLFFLVAFTRYDLFDVDRLISATAAWTLLAAVALGALLTIGRPAAEWAGAQTGLQASTWLWALALCLALPATSGVRRLRPWLERTLFRDRDRIERGLRALRSQLSDASSPGVLLRSAAARLVDILALDACAVYGRAGDQLVSSWAHGPLVPPSFAAQGALARAMADAAAPVPATRFQQWARRGRVPRAEIAGLEAFGACVVAPLFRGDVLAGLLCLGEKRSGDVFTATEIALLEALAERVSLQLEAFDVLALEREQRSLYEELASYAPGAVAEALRRGDSIEPGEREISVLFVDIRGYTTFSQQREAPEIFRVVGRYTDAVSREVIAQGGSVVEFHGDGLLAVFGAIGDGAGKQRAAVQAARGIVKAVDLGDLADGVPLSCGVGVATGPAFVGHIHAVDRRLWNVIGNTVNLAARFEGLTRDFDVSIVIDDATKRGAGEHASDFARRDGVHVKGRDDAFVLWTKRLLPD